MKVPTWLNGVYTSITAAVAAENWHDLPVQQRWRVEAVSSFFCRDELVTTNGNEKLNLPLY